MMQKVKSVLKRLARRLQKLRGDSQANILSAESACKLEDSASSSEASAMDDDPRYEASDVLFDAGIPSCVFGEDALYQHGVPTVVFDLYLVVPDIVSATRVLVASGFIETLEPESTIDAIPEFRTKLVRKYAHGEQATESRSALEVVLLKADDWAYKLPDSVETMHDYFPPLNNLLDSLMFRWTNENSHSLRSHLAVLISYCYLYVDGVKAMSYASNLSMENRQLHYDQVSEDSAGDLGTPRCQLHYRAIRDLIRRGELVPIGPSGVRLFPPRRRKQTILATE